MDGRSFIQPEHYEREMLRAALLRQVDELERLQTETD